MARSLSKSKRFNVFERHSFTCQYCGRQAPDVVLEVDHLLPVAEGGNDDDENLVTSCFDCNRGKGKKVIGSIRPSEMQQEELDQRRAVLVFQMKREELIQQEFDYWIGQLEIAFGYYFDDDQKRSIKGFRKRSLPWEEIKTFAELASTRCSSKSFSQKFRYFCGCCWTRVSQLQDVREVNDA